MAPHVSILATLATTLALAGCLLPTGVYGTGDLTVASLLTSGTGAARLVGLTASGGDVDVPITSDRSAFLMFNSQNSAPERMAVDIQPNRAFRVASTASAPSQAPEVPGSAPFEARLRHLEAPMRQLTSRPGYTLQQAAPIQKGTTGVFWVIEEILGGEASETQVKARVAYVGQHCYVYLDSEVPDGRMDERLELIGRTFDEKIFPTNSRLFGAPVPGGPNADARVTLLISPAVGNYGQDTTIGYFTVRDLFPPEADPENPVLRRSNQRLMLYIAANVVSRGEPSDFLGTIAHELQHLINASQKIFRPQGKARTEELWLDEGMSMYAMEANGYGLGGAGDVVFNHVQEYQRRAAQYSLTDWRLNADESGYGIVYLFTTYLVDRFGEGLLRALVGGTQPGIANIDAQLRPHNSSFEQAFDDWSAANLLDDTGLTSDPRYQYKSLNMLGSYGGRKLRGMTLEPVALPNTGALTFKPHSAHYYYVPRGNGGNFRFSIDARGTGGFSGLVVAP